MRPYSATRRTSSAWSRSEERRRCGTQCRRRRSSALMNGGRMIMSSATTKTHNTTTSPTWPTAHEEVPTSEEIVIGTVLADPKLASRVYARLGPEDLGEPRVAWIYEAAMELARKGEAV